MRSQSAFRQQAEQFRRLADASADELVSRLAREIAERLDQLAEAIQDSAKPGG
jgi:hypothetical protein